MVPAFAVGSQHSGSGMGFWDGEKGGSCILVAASYLWMGYGTVPIKSILVDKVNPGEWAALVKVNDSGYEFIAGMLAGSVGIGSLGSVDGELTAKGSVGKETLWPEVGWWMMKVESENQTVGVLINYVVVMG